MKGGRKGYGKRQKQIERIEREREGLGRWGGGGGEGKKREGNRHSAHRVIL